MAALISGSVMIAVAVLLLVEHGSGAWRRQPILVRLHSALNPFGASLVAVLALCFAVYAVGLVRLNLGLPIPS